jgi:hypothetical protein
VNVSTAPSPTGNTEQVFCKEVTVANLVSTGTNVKWFDIPTGGTPLAETLSLENGKHYYASQQPGTCPSTQRLDVTVTISITPPPNAPESQNLCSGATLANITANGTDLKWYAAIAGGIPLAPVTVLHNNQSYFVSQTVNTCESARMPVIITLSPTPPVPTGEKTQMFCHSGTVADLVVVGDDVQWFDASVGGNLLSISTMLVDEKHYYAAQAGACASPERLDVSVILRAPEVPTASALQTFCGTATLADLFVTGTDLTWYGMPNSQTALPITTILEDGHTYFVTQSIENCKSAPLEITTAVNDIPAAPTGESFLALEKNKTVADLVVTGQAITWYPSVTDAINRSNALSPSQGLVDNQSYFATQTLSGCESTEVLSVTVGIITSLETRNVVLSYHPNPVKDYLEISMARTIGVVSLQNTFGQIVFAGEFKSAEGVIDFTGFASGVYILRIGEGREMGVVKVLKE